MSKQKKDKNEIVEHTGEYLVTLLNLSTAKLVQKTAETGASAGYVVLLVIFFFLTLIMATIGLAFLIGTFARSHTLGFFTVALLFFLILAGLIISGSKLLIPYMQNKLVSFFYKRKKQ